MRIINRQRNHITLLLYLFLFPVILEGQSYKFRNYGNNPGLPDKYIYNISQDNSGFLWIGTGSGLVKFDGINFYNVAFPDTISDRYASVSLKDKNGNLWFGCNDGSLFYTSDNRLVKVPDLKIQNINYMFESGEGYLFIIPQDKMILRININKPDEITRFYLTRDLSMTTACLTLSGNLIIGTQESLVYCTLEKDSVRVNNSIDGIENTKVEAIRSLNLVPVTLPKRT